MFWKKKEVKYYTQEQVNTIIYKLKEQQKKQIKQKEETFEDSIKFICEELNKVFKGKKEERHYGKYGDYISEWRTNLESYIIYTSDKAVCEVRKDYINIIKQEIQKVVKDEDLIKKFVKRINDHQIK